MPADPLLMVTGPHGLCREATIADLVFHLSSLTPDDRLAALRKIKAAFPNEEAIFDRERADRVSNKDGDELRTLRASLGLTLGQAARLLDVRVSVLSDAERGRNDQAPELTIRLAERALTMINAQSGEAP